MNTTMPPRQIFITALLAVLALGATARAQDPAPSPSPSPSASPASVKVEPRDVDDDVDVDVDVDVHVDADRIEAEVDRANASARREMERALREAEISRADIEKEARKAAKNMALTDAQRRQLSAEARATAEAAMHESRASRETAMREAMQDAQQEAREKALEERNRARERQLEERERAREKAQEAREREREKREAVREESERIDDLYDEAMESIDDEEWSDALRPLSKLMSLNVKVDAALYWTSYAQAKMNRAAASLASLARLQKEFPTSRWAKEGKALELEVRGKAGQTPRPDQEDDADLKLMAVSAMAQSDPQEALPVLTKILAAPSSSRRVKERSLFVLAQMGTEQASSAIAEVARGNSSPELQRKAIQYLGVFGGPTNRKVLSEVYSSTTDNALRKQILNSFMVSGDRARVLTAAKTEKDPALRSTAIRLLGVMQGTTELGQMYATAATADEKKDILQALFVGGATDQVAAAARSEKDKEVRLVAVRNLGLMGRKSETVLAELYRVETDPEVKKEVLNAFFLQGNAVRLVEIAKVEKDPTLKKEAVHWLSLTNSKEARAYMIELLKD
ncbi:MAG: HEAT repeat domain-containing protein [Vicinamibacteria bacterium]|nr:HEAT repeat domain-containing protein [Vicinamibacteria bacterium]